MTHPVCHECKAPMRRDVGMVLARLEGAGFQSDAQVARGRAAAPVVQAAAGTH